MVCGPFEKNKALQIAQDLYHYTATIFYDEAGHTHFFFRVTILPVKETQRKRLLDMYTSYLKMAGISPRDIKEYVDDLEESQYTVVAIIGKRIQGETEVMIAPVRELNTHAGLVYYFDVLKDIR